MDVVALRELPKIELHVHLEAAMSLDCLIELYQRYEPEVSISKEVLATQLSCHSLQSFLKHWRWVQYWIRSVEDYEAIAYSAAQAQADDGIVYCEMFFSASAVMQKGLPLPEVVAAILNGFRREPRIRIKLIADITRDFGEYAAIQLLDSLNQVDDVDVVGVGLGGSEHQFPAKIFKRVFLHARELGYQCTAHAGEMAGAQSIQMAVHGLGVRRLGHATRICEQPALLDILAEQNICVEACPGSNLMTGVIEDRADYPLRTLLQASVPVCMNSDDPLIFGKRLSEEIAATAKAFALQTEEIIQLQRNAWDAAWLDHEERTVIAKQLPWLESQ